MKNLYITILCLFSLTSLSQNDILGEWFLYNINIEGTNYDNIYENNFNINFHDPFTTPFNISGSGVCNVYFGNYSLEEQGEISTQDCGITLILCAGADFENNHLYMIYCNYDNNDPELLNYEVIGNGNNATLTITNTTNNNFAVYGRQTLSSADVDFNKTTVKLKENPVKNQLEVVIENSTFDQITYTIYSFDGKLISNTKPLENNIVNLNNFNQGLYFITFVTDENQPQTLKFIKE